MHRNLLGSFRRGMNISVPLWLLFGATSIRLRVRPPSVGQADWGDQALE